VVLWRGKAKPFESAAEDVEMIVVGIVEKPSSAPPENVLLRTWVGPYNAHITYPPAGHGVMSTAPFGSTGPLSAIEEYAERLFRSI